MGVDVIRYNAALYIIFTICYNQDFTKQVFWTRILEEDMVKETYTDKVTLTRRHAITDRINISVQIAILY